MNTHCLVSFLTMVLFAALLAPAAAQAQAPYTADWDSLYQHNPAPDWFRDAKFGIYFHWGVYCVPAFGSEWYPRNMHIEKNREHKHHLEKYGDPAEFGYHDFVPMFRAEHFDPEDWAELFAKAGAQFAGPVAEHHDGFAMWDSELTPWNAMDKGPKRDIAGELAKAIRKRGMRFAVSFHHARNNQHQIESQGKKIWTGHYPRVEGWPTVSEDPELRMLYGNLPRPDFLEMWNGKLAEVIDKYQPDLIWFDSWLDEIPESHQTQFLAYYLNRAAEWNKDVVVTCKQRDLPLEVAVEDFEKGRTAHITEYPFLTDDTISYGSWCYTENLRIKPTSEVLHVFIDIVSKNGQLLLNLSPKANGEIPAVQRQVLLDIGQWLEVCGEAIYGTRPFLLFGEGPTRLRKAGHFVKAGLEYSPQDIRFTRKGNVLYAIALGWPEDELIIETLGTKRMPGLAVKELSLLGSDATIAWSQEADGLHLNPPETPPCEHAFAFKILLDGTATACTGIEVLDAIRAQAGVRVLNLGEAPWTGTAALKTNAETLGTQPITVEAGGFADCTLAGQLPADGFHALRVLVDDAEIGAEDVVTPRIGLREGWRFQPGDDMAWAKPGFEDTQWQQVTLPQSWEVHSDYHEDPAFGWYRKTVTIPASWKGHDLILPLGQIDDADETYFNGEFLGDTGKLPPRYATGWDRPRRYRVREKHIRFGKENTIAVRVYDARGDGGMRGGPLGPIELVAAR